MARLLLESGGERREIKVAGPVTVGRSQSASVYLDDKTLSREHTQFYLQNGRLLVKDLDSKNGTYPNGSLIKDAQALKHGDRVKVGVATFTVALEAGDAMPAVTAPLAAPPPRPSVPIPTTVTAPTVPARPRAPVDGIHWFSVFFYRVILVAVFIVVAVMSRGFFQSLLRGK